MVTSVLKRDGRGEPYAATKLHGSISQACLAVRAFEGEASLLAERVTGAVSGWVADKAEVTSRDIKGLAGRLLGDLHPDAAYAYLTHDDVL